MSTELKPPSSKFLSFLVVNRQQVAIGLATLGVILAGFAILWGVWGFGRSEDAGPAKDSKVKFKMPGETAPKPADANAKPPKSRNYMIACIGAGGVSLLCLLSALWLLTQPADPANEELSARKEVLTFGATAGLLVFMCGGFLVYAWHTSITKWIGSDDATEAKWVFYAASVFLAGLLIMFASLQLARAEQRTNAGLRRLLYAFNTVFAGLLLLLVLIVVNLFAMRQLPETLVTNDAAYTELSDESKSFLKSLDLPVRVYLILREKHEERITEDHSYSTLYTDCLAFLSECEDQNPLFKVTYLSPTFDVDRTREVMERLKVKQADRDSFGMLVAVGDNEELVSFIRSDDLVTVGRSGVAFQGESKLLNELIYLTDTRSNEKIYITQGHGELSMQPGGTPDKTLNLLVEYLREKHLTVEPLGFEGADPKVPDDAAVVIVAGLRRALSDNDPMLPALRDYLKRPGKPGKLFLCLPAFRDVSGKIAATGLEGLLADYGVNVEPAKRLLGRPGEIALSATRYAPPDFLKANPLEIDGPLGRVIGTSPVIVRDSRPIKINPQAQQAGAYRPQVIMVTSTVTWQEPDFDRDMNLSLLELAQDTQGNLRREKMYSTRSEPLAVAVVEASPPGEKATTKPVMMIFASDTFMQDRGPAIAGADISRQQLISNSLDWLRERNSSMNIPPRKVNIFVLEKPIDGTSQLTLLGMITLGISVLGGGVWLSRRR